LNILDGVTATTAELNILGGVTATAAELNAIVINAPLLADLEALTGTDGQQVTTSGRTAVGDGGGGSWVWDSSNLSTEVTADTESGIYVAPTSDATGASGAWVRQYVSDIDPAWFGAIADGITEDYAALQAAFGYLGEYPISLKPYATYKVTGALDYTSDTAKVITLKGNGATIDGTDEVIVNDTQVSLSGGLLGVATAISDASEGDSSIVSTLSGVVAGDILQITSTDLFNPTRANYYKGEFVQVESVSGTTFTLTTPLEDEYTGANTTAQRVNMPQIHVTDLNILRDGDNIGLKVIYSRNVKVDSVSVTGSRFTGISLGYCYGGVVWNNYSFDMYYTGSGNSYGIVVVSSQNLTLESNTLYGGRHALSCGGNEPCRHLKIVNNTCGSKSDLAVGGLDTHGNCEHILIEGNTVYGHINAISSNTVVRGNTVYTSKTVKDSGIYVYQEIDSAYNVIEDNVVEVVNGFSGVWVINSAPITLSYVKIEGNKIITTIDQASHANILISSTTLAASDLTIAKLSIKNNDLNSLDGGAPPQRNISMYNAGVNTIIFDYVYIEDNHMISESVNIFISTGVVSGVLNVLRNTLIASGATMRPIQTTVNNFVDLNVSGNKFINTNAADGYRNDLFATNEVRFEDNILDNFGYNRGLNVGSGVLAIVNGNTYYNDVGVILSSATSTVGTDWN
jgi:hypothetical protein